MTAFVYSKFEGSEYVTYEGAFVARFKRGGRVPFIKFLVANFSTEEYFSRLAVGELPLPILQSKGYIQPHVARMMKQYGLPVSRASMPLLLKRVYNPSPVVVSQAIAV